MDRTSLWGGYTGSRRPADQQDLSVGEVSGSGVTLASRWPAARYPLIFLRQRGMIRVSPYGEEAGMTLLRDEDLVTRVQAEPQLVRGLRPPADWYGRESPVQSASVDLSVGDIFIPGTEPDALGSAESPRTEWTLGTGETAVVTTQEELRIPASMAAIGFPPSRVSFRGLLMTNPGHIDPGYWGVLRFTVINMGRQPYALKRGDVIVSVLFFELARQVKADYVARRPGYAPSGPIREQIDRLSNDFVNVENRSRDIAKSEAREAGIKIAAIGASVSLLFAALTLGQNAWSPPWRPALETKVAVLERSTQFEKETSTIRAHETRLEVLAAELAQVRAQTCKQRPVPAYCGASARP